MTIEEQKEKIDQDINNRCDHKQRNINSACDVLDCNACNMRYVIDRLAAALEKIEQYEKKEKEYILEIGDDFPM